MKLGGRLATFVLFVVLAVLKMGYLKSKIDNDRPTTYRERRSLEYQAVKTADEISMVFFEDNGSAAQNHSSKAIPSATPSSPRGSSGGVHGNPFVD